MFWIMAHYLESSGCSGLLLSSCHHHRLSLSCLYCTYTQVCMLRTSITHTFTYCPGLSRLVYFYCFLSTFTLISTSTSLCRVYCSSAKLSRRSATDQNIPPHVIHNLLASFIAYTSLVLSSSSTFAPPQPHS